MGIYFKEGIFIFTFVLNDFQCDSHFADTLHFKPPISVHFSGPSQSALERGVWPVFLKFYEGARLFLEKSPRVDLRTRWVLVGWFPFCFGGRKGRGGLRIRDEKLGTTKSQHGI